MQNNNAAPAKRFYVYTLSDGDTVFYVGKGTGRRYLDHEGHARSGRCYPVCAIIRAMWEREQEVTKRIVFETEDEQEAYRYETQEIARHPVGQLVNCITLRQIDQGSITQLSDSQWMCEIVLYYENGRHRKMRHIRPTQKMAQIWIAAAYDRSYFRHRNTVLANIAAIRSYAL
jgi:hypothetical protein